MDLVCGKGVGQGSKRNSEGRKWGQDVRNEQAGCEEGNE